MRNLKPITIILGGSALLFLVTLIALLITKNFVDLDQKVILIVPMIVGLACYGIFYFFIKTYITEKLRILYRSIRKGKFQHSADDYRLSDDIIEQAQKETNQWSEERNAEISRLKEQEEFRREFLGNLAHELKTPVFSIQGYILTLLEGGLEDKNVNRKFLEKASKATERMSTLLDDLDQITKMEVNKIDLRFTNFDIVELVQEIFESLEVKATEKGMTLRLAKEYDKVLVYADRGKIGQVITNLVGNSIAYGHEDGETVVRFYTMDDIVTIEVSDNGPGIAEEEIPRLFERFYRVEKSRNRHEGGSGLGLAIAKNIIDAHGQTINVRSTLGVGSTFTFSLDRGRSGRRAVS